MEDTFAFFLLNSKLAASRRHQAVGGLFSCRFFNLLAETLSLPKIMRHKKNVGRYNFFKRLIKFTYNTSTRIAPLGSLSCRSGTRLSHPTIFGSACDGVDSHLKSFIYYSTSALGRRCY